MDTIPCDIEYILFAHLFSIWASLVAQMVKNLPAKLIPYT